MALAESAPRVRSRPDLWTLAALVIAGLILAPLLAVGWMAFFPTENIWPHLISSVLPGYVHNTVVLMLITGGGAAVIGTSAAWLVVMTEFPGRRVFDWALLAPLAVPAYIGAYALVDFFEYAGPVQVMLRGFFGWTDARDYWFPEIRTIWSAGFVLTLSLYPYVYLLARAAFREQSVCALEVARSLGCGPWTTFFRVALPLARPAVAAGVAIVAMETLNDFGAIDFFAVRTLTAGVFSVWLEGANSGGAAQISCVILGFVLVVLGLESAGRRGKRYHAMSRRYRPIERVRLRGGRAALAVLGCAAPVGFGFILPITVIASLALHHTEGWLEPAFWDALARTIWLAATAAAVAVGAGLLLVFGARRSRGRATKLIARATMIGYAAPGAVLAVGVLIPLAALDRRIHYAALDLFGVGPGLLLTGTAAAVIFAYVVRFNAIAYGALDGAFGRVTPSMDMAARTLGETAGGALRRVHLPIISGSMMTAAMLIFVDAVKELPATLILRPFNFSTLATHVYDFASREHLAEAAPAALAIVVVGMAPVAVLIRGLGVRRPGEQMGRAD
ncbi:iron ABC transporter permease [Pikeienuella piscinae]|uniref:Iron ABC transporter permease n=1 Tax=Pikeienuella piscinae TaxID=2748098 RepID=A0A7L5BYI9_9RHOB|nr:iron ABC transporter permease [Pikeienuella piscinae]QIE54669.1 iron ABC transporter permease [Pikeienuella piscinae]